MSNVIKAPVQEARAGMTIFEGKRPAKVRMPAKFDEPTPAVKDQYDAYHLTENNRGFYVGFHIGSYDTVKAACSDAFERGRLDTSFCVCCVQDDADDRPRTERCVIVQDGHLVVCGNTIAHAGLQECGL